MEIKKVNFNKDSTTIVVKGTSPSYMNTLRRLIINRVPTMAIDEVTFIENGSALYDEILANRMGLVPLSTDLESYFEKAKCKCKGAGCARCQLTITLNKTGPCIVYAEDLKTKDPKVKPVYPKMPIVKLLEGQSLKIEATASLGCGKEHVKHAPGLAYYQGYPIIKTKDSKDAKKAEEQCPKKILKADGQKLKVTDELKCDLCKACEAVCDEISVTSSNKDFIFTLESWGQISTKEIFAQAMKIFDEELDELDKEIKKIK